MSEGPLAFVADLDAPTLGPDDEHHLRKALRLAPGAPLVLSDGAGRWCSARLGPGPVPSVVGDVVHDLPLEPALTVAFAPVKGDRPEWAVQKLTELGVDRIGILWAARSVVRWEGDRTDRHLVRLRRVAREAAAQCRRTRLPEVVLLGPVADAARLPGACRAQQGGAPPSLAHPVVLVGPEGGWDPRERDDDVPEVGLGPHTLRGETAAVAAGVVLAALRLGVVEPTRSVSPIPAPRH
jgi:16S rRNA (uracil1498-N3)-methyltransferase